MANEEHVKRLKHSIEEWNRWREKQRDTRPDLIEANLRGAELIEANLNRVNLYGADLSDADLHDADLHDAELIEAKLRGAKLRGADLNRANLYEANLRGANLRGANLNRANLCGADLIEAELSDAELIEAKLRKADLRGADLNRAKLRKADLSGADLSKANLSKADLSGADLSGADLRGADLRGAIMINCLIGRTVLAFTDLSAVHGLDTVRHRGKSALDLITVILPHGSARTALLRGVGYPETMVDYYDAIFTQPIQFYSCFISYTQTDEEVAWKLYTDLQNAGIRCFFAPHDLKPGDYYHKRIDKEIQVYDKLLLLLSEQSVQSTWVEHEVMGALGREKRERREILFPLRLDDTVMEMQTDWAQALRDTRHIGDMTRWQQKETYKVAFQEVVRHLKVGLIPPPK